MTSGHDVDTIYTSELNIKQRGRAMVAILVVILDTPDGAEILYVGTSQEWAAKRSMGQNGWVRVQRWENEELIDEKSIDMYAKMEKRLKIISQLF